MTNSNQFDRLRETLDELDENKFLKILDEILSLQPNAAQIDQTFKAIQAGMEAVGEKYQSGEYYLAEMLFAAEMVNQAMPKIFPLLKGSGQKQLGKVLIGTVQGDIHDIGKNLVGILLTSSGFEVIDLGIDVPVARWVSAIREYQPDIIGLSSLLTLSINSMHTTVAAIRDAGLRDQVKIIIGGNPVTQAIHVSVGSDAWANNAAQGVAICRAWMEG